MSELFKPCKLTRFELAHKIVYAPLTRCRADGKGVQPKEAATYYAQRATAGGLLISEATNICPGAQGDYFDLPFFNLARDPENPTKKGKKNASKQKNKKRLEKEKKTPRKNKPLEPPFFLFQATPTPPGSGPRPRSRHGGR